MKDLFGINFNWWVRSDVYLRIINIVLGVDRLVFVYTMCVGVGVVV